MANNHREANIYGNFRNFENWTRYNDYMMNYDRNAGEPFIPHEFFADNIRFTDEEILMRYKAQLLVTPRIIGEPLLKYIIADILEGLEDMIKPPV